MAADRADVHRGDVHRADVDPLDVERRVRRFLAERFGGYRDEVGYAESLEGVVDSLGLFDLVEFVEREFSIRISNADFSPTRFSSLERIVDTVREFSGTEA